MSARPPIPETYPVAWPMFRFARATGRVELAVGEGLIEPHLRPEQVTALLVAMLESVDGQAATPDLITRLSVGTREWLLQQCGSSCRPAQDWFEATCPSCGTGFDLVLDLAALPIAVAPVGFPEVALATSSGSFAAQVPNGAHELALAQSGKTGLEAARALLELCVLDEAAVAQISALSDAEIGRLEATLDDATPDCADAVTSPCPGCGTSVTARIDPLEFAFPGEGLVLADIHLLGCRYNWGENDILDLPTRRRRAYVTMIAQSSDQARSHQVGAQP